MSLYTTDIILSAWASKILSEEGKPHCLLLVHKIYSDVQVSNQLYIDEENGKNEKKTMASEY